MDEATIRRNSRISLYHSKFIGAKTIVWRRSDRFQIFLAGIWRLKTKTWMTKGNSLSSPIMFGSMPDIRCTQGLQSRHSECLQTIHVNEVIKLRCCSVRPWRVTHIIYVSWLNNVDPGINPSHPISHPGGIQTFISNSYFYTNVPGAVVTSLSLAGVGRIKGLYI